MYGKSTKVLDDIKNLLNKGTNEIIVVTPDLDDEFANLLLYKASRGTKTTVITGDTDWASWLENKKKSYGLDEIKEIMKNEEYNRKTLQKFKNLRISIPTLLIGVALSFLFVTHYFLSTIPNYISFIPLPIALIVSIYTIILASKKIKNLNETLAYQDTMINERKQETEIVREELNKNLRVIVNEKASFSIIFADNEGYILSIPLKNENREKIVLIEKVSKEEVEKVMSILCQSPNHT
jgi:hypothetical protein